jgi:selenocysteine lyase/cysteine desulfurase
MSPLLKTVEAAGVVGIQRKVLPYQISQESFFDELDSPKKLFSQLINCPDPERIAIIPSVSYGMATVAKNLAAKPSLVAGQQILTIEEEFPSDVYAWDALCAEKQLSLKTVAKPAGFENRGKRWNEAILEAINHKVCMVVIPHIHWTDGTIFDLVAIAQRARDFGALVVIDGTQSVGALPIDIQAIQPDALICASYKCMMGPYSIGLAYYGEYFDTGSPIEQSWVNRIASNDFKNLINYQSNYRPKAFRYSVGQQSNFILLPMLIKALEVLNDWTPEGVQNYTQALVQEPLALLKEKGFWSENQSDRASHLFGIFAPQNTDITAIQAKLAAKNIYVSLRGNAIRVSPSVYNDASDLQALIDVL